MIAMAATSANAQPATVSHGRRLLQTASRSVIWPRSVDQHGCERAEGAGFHSGEYRIKQSVARRRAVTDTAFRAAG